MRLTTVRLLDLVELSGTAFRVYVTAHARLAETGSDRLSIAALMHLPGMPRDAKALGRALTELGTAGHLVSEGGGYTFKVTSELSAKRAAAGRAGGLAKASKTLASASGLLPSLPDGLPATCQDNARDPSPSLVLSPSDSRDSGSGFSESSSALSSGSEPESKPARRRRERFVPEVWAPNDGHQKLARSLGVNLESQVVLFRNHEYDKPKLDWDRAFNTWLRRSAEFARPPGFVAHQAHLEETRRRPEHQLLRPRPEPTETVSAAELERAARGRV